MVGISEKCVFYLYTFLCSQSLILDASHVQMEKKELKDTLEKSRESSGVGTPSKSLEMVNRHLSGSSEVILIHVIWKSVCSVYQLFRLFNFS